MRTTDVVPERVQGFAGIAHGGILATILDECMVNTVWLRGGTAVTARLEVRLRRPVAVLTTIRKRGSGCARSNAARSVCANKSFYSFWITRCQILSGSTR